MNIYKYITLIFLSSSITVLYGQEIVSNKGDKILLSDYAIEPWYVENSDTKASTNTQNIYQNGNVAVGLDLSTSIASSKLEVFSPSTSQFGLSQSLSGTKWDLFAESDGMSFIQKRPSNTRNVIFYNNASVAFGEAILDTSPDPILPSVGFYYSGNNKRLKIGNVDNVSTATLATQTLDVQNNVRIRALKNVNTDVLSKQYNRDVIADANGNLAFLESKKADAGWVFVNFKSSKMTQAVPASITGNGNVKLNNMLIPVTVPPFTAMQIKVNYNSPIIHTGTIGYAGYTLFKRVNGGANQELDMGSRKYTILGSYSTASAAYGLPIEGAAIDVITNNTASSMNVEYEVFGYIESSNGSQVTFGMYSTSGANYNWGRGAMCLEIYSKSLN